MSLLSRHREAYPNNGRAQMIASTRELKRLRGRYRSMLRGHAPSLQAQDPPPKRLKMLPRKRGFKR